MEEYTRELKKDDYLAKYTQTRHPVQLTFQGCHLCRLRKVQGMPRRLRMPCGEKTPHAHAHQTLVDAKNKCRVSPDSA